MVDDRDGHRVERGVLEVAPGETWPLRRSVLRAGRPDADVSFTGDDAPGSFHLAVAGDDELVAVASFIPEPDGKGSEFRLRGMAVQPTHRGRGLGSVLLDAGLRRLASRGVESVWANGRDSALGFYLRLGWRVEGDGFVGAEGVAHHRIVCSIPRAEA